MLQVPSVVKKNVHIIGSEIKAIDIPVFISEIM